MEFDKIILKFRKILRIVKNEKWWDLIFDEIRSLYIIKYSIQKQKSI